MLSGEIAKHLEALSPRKYACGWDNVGLLVGSSSKEIKHILVSLDFDNATVNKAIEIGADMIVTHHPIIFSGMKSITDGSVNGSRVLKLLNNGICGYSMHTNFDVKGGMAELAANLIGITDCIPLEITCEEGNNLEGIGRVGNVADIISVKEWCNKVKRIFDLTGVILYGDPEAKVERVAISPGSGKDFVEVARMAGANLLITGDINHHTGIDAIDMGLNIIDASHYGTEHIFVNYMVDYLKSVCEQDVEIIGMEQKMPFMIL